MAAGLASVLFSTACFGADIRGRSSTQLFFYDDYIDGRQVELTEYLRLDLTGIDQAGKTSFHGYGRGSQELKGGDGFHSRLYYFYGQYRDLFGLMDLRVGRQFVNLSAGSAIIDGGTLDFRGIPYVGVTVVGGRDVLFGTETEIGKQGTDFGASVYLRDLKRTDLDLSCLITRRNGDQRESLGASFKQYLFDTLWVSGYGRYDLIGEEWNQLQIGTRYFPISSLVLSAEYYQSTPVFDSSSIYSAFAVNQYREGILRGEYFFSDRFSLNAGYNRQSYGDGGVADVYHVGCGIRLVESLRVNAEYDRRRGYYGEADGVAVDASYEFMRKGEVAAGFYYDVYTRDVMTGDDIARSSWIGGRYRVAQNVVISGRLQNDVNARYSENVSGRFVFDDLF